MYLLSQINSGLQERQLTFKSAFWKLSNKMCCKQTWTFNTCLFTPWIRVLLEQLTVHLLFKVATFYGTRMFFTAFTSACNLSLFWARSIQSLPPYPTSWRPILQFSSHPTLGLPSGLFPSDFPSKSLYTGSSKKMDGIWNRYNLKSTGRIYTFGVLKCSEKFKVLDLP